LAEIIPLAALASAQLVEWPHLIGPTEITDGLT
jgi:hypothetical protein